MTRTRRKESIKEFYIQRVWRKVSLKTAGQFTHELAILDTLSFQTDIFNAFPRC